MPSQDAMGIDRFDLPLGRESLRTAIERGHGRALMHAIHHGLAGCTDLVLEACLRAKAYDPQCEADRADWLIEIIDAAGVESEVCPGFIEAFGSASELNRFWDLNQQCRLALRFAQRGDEDGRKALYGALAKSDVSADIIAGEEIIELDGADGLIFVVERLGEWVECDSSIYVGADPLNWYDEHHGAGTAERVLRHSAEQNGRIAAYLKHLDRETTSDAGSYGFHPAGGHLKPEVLRFSVRHESRAKRLREMSAGQVIDSIEASDPAKDRHWYAMWGKHASEESLREVAGRLFAEQHVGRLFKYLKVFQHRALPRFDSRLLAFGDHADRDVRWIAMWVLSNHAHPEVRALAQSRARAGRNSEGELRLFRNNCQPGDWGIIVEALRVSDDRDAVHALVWDLLDVFESNAQSADLPAPMILVYEHSPCSNCRGRAVKALLRANRAPNWVVEECRFDVDEDTRKVVAEFGGGQ